MTATAGRPLGEHARHPTHQHQPVIAAQVNQIAASRRLHKLAQRRERHRHRQRLAGPDQKRHALAGALPELPHQRALADPRLPGNQHNGPPAGRRVLDRVGKHAQLIFTLEKAHHRARSYGSPCPQ